MNKKLVLSTSICFTFALGAISSCANRHTHAYSDLFPAVKTTCTTDGNIAYYKCTTCGHYFNEELKEVAESDVFMKAQGHVFGALLPYTEPTCDKAGHIAYYHCYVCDANEDENHQPVENVTIPATGHSYSCTITWDGVTPSYTISCSKCSASSEQLAKNFNAFYTKEVIKYPTKSSNGEIKYTFNVVNKNDPSMKWSDSKVDTNFAIKNINVNDEAVTTYLNASTSKEQFAALKKYSIKQTGIGHDFEVNNTINWLSDGSKSFTIHLADNEQFENEEIYVTNSNNFTYSFKPNTICYYKVYSENNPDFLLDVGVLGIDDGVRYVNTSSVGNVRDIGGYKNSDGQTVKYGKLFRGRNLDSISTADKKVFNEQLKIKTEIDFRENSTSKVEVANPKPYDDRVAYYFYNSSAIDDGLMQSIVNGTSLKGPCVNPDPELNGKTLTYKYMYQEVFTMLANEESYPIYFHCVSGADRTGALGFMINGLLGVSYDDLTRDYELTSFSKNVGSNRWRRDPNNDDLSIADDFDLTKDYYTVGSWKTYWPKLYSYIISKGQSNDLSVAIANFLKTYCGITDNQINAIKTNLLA